ncbi:carbohydrate ABC transporter permease [Kribbella deserti]|uniref:Carbohydrate ABC transporter permease n=1 Tax=Kribbella deserti TaxID=1926257 RepID=A0ABV6QJ29_9ACTN
MRDTTGFKIYRAVVLTVLGVFTVIPLYVMATSSLKPLSDVQGAFEWWPSNLTVEPFFEMWRTVPLARYFVNSTIVAVVATVLSVAVAILAAFAVSRFRFRGRGTFTTSVLSTQMFPGVLFLLPLFLISSTSTTRSGCSWSAPGSG